MAQDISAIKISESYANLLLADISTVPDATGIPYDLNTPSNRQKAQIQDGTGKISPLFISETNIEVSSAPSTNNSVTRLIDLINVGTKIVENIELLESEPRIPGKRVDVIDSTGIESYVRASGIPFGFEGSDKVKVTVIYDGNSETWNFSSLTAINTETRYVNLETGLSSQLLINDGGNLAYLDTSGIYTTTLEAVNPTSINTVLLPNSSGTLVLSGAIVDVDVAPGANISGTKIAQATTSARGTVQLTSALDSESVTLAPTALALKTTYDLAANAMPITGGTFLTSNIEFQDNALSEFSTSLSFTSSQNNVIYFPDDTGTLVLSGKINNGDIAELASISGSKIQLASVFSPGVVTLSNSVSSTSQSEASTPYALKLAYDLASAAMPKSGGTFSTDTITFRDVDFGEYFSALTFTTPTANRTLTFPDSSGEVALTSQVNQVSEVANEALYMTGFRFTLGMI